MGLSRDADRTTLTCTVWPLEGVKILFCFSWFLRNISGTVGKFFIFKIDFNYPNTFSVMV